MLDSSAVTGFSALHGPVPEEKIQLVGAAGGLSGTAC